MIASHSMREHFVADLVRLTGASGSQCQRLLRLGSAYALAIQNEQPLRQAKLERRIIQIGQELRACVVFTGSEFAVRLLVDGKSIDVPTSQVEENGL